jgi:GntR family transcriptional regulator, arabinose operon transcriptional repressor
VQLVYYSHYLSIIIKKERTTIMAEKILEIETEHRQLAHSRVRNEFLKRLKSGKWTKNELIPSENQLAKEYNLSRKTIRKALITLEEEGYLLAEKGRGRIVSATPDEHLSDSALKTVGLLVSQSNDCYGEFTQIYRTVSENNHNLTIYTLRPEDSSSPLENISHLNTSGILVYCQQILKSDIVDFSKTIPTVSLKHRCSDFGIPSFYLSWSLAAYQCSMHLLERGYDYLMLENSSTDYHSQWNVEFYEGFSGAHASSNISISRENIFCTRLRSECYFDTDFEKILLAIKKHGRVGIVTYFSMSTIDIVKKALSCGIRIPEQLGIVCITDTDALKKSPIPITAVSFNRLTMVEQAAKTLIKMINGDLINNVDNPFHGKLMIRNST